MIQDQDPKHGRGEILTLFSVGANTILWTALEVRSGNTPDQAESCKVGAPEPLRLSCLGEDLMARGSGFFGIWFGMEINGGSSQRAVAANTRDRHIAYSHCHLNRCAGNQFLAQLIATANTKWILHVDMTDFVEVYAWA